MIWHFFFFPSFSPGETAWKKCRTFCFESWLTCVIVPVEHPQGHITKLISTSPAKCITLWSWRWFNSNMGLKTWRPQQSQVHFHCRQQCSITISDRFKDISSGNCSWFTAVAQSSTGTNLCCFSANSYILAVIALTFICCFLESRYKKGQSEINSRWRNLHFGMDVGVQGLAIAIEAPKVSQ